MSTGSWQLWRRQVLGVARLDLKRNFLTRRALWVYLLAAAPVVIFALGALAQASSHVPIGMATHDFAAAFQVFFLRFVVFFGCAGIFLNLFHGEVLDKSLHFYFLAPVRREVLLAGKYLAGLTAASGIFCASVALQFAAVYSKYDSASLQEFLVRGGGWEQLAAYLGVTILACAGYGSVFLFLGVLFRNALLPSILVLIWEIVSGYLPPLFQKLSIIYYLKSMCPVKVEVTSLSHGGPLSFFAFNPEPALAPVAIVAILVLSGVLLTLASLRLGRMEIDYGAE